MSGPGLRLLRPKKPDGENWLCFSLASIATDGNLDAIAPGRGSRFVGINSNGAGPSNDRCLVRKSASATSLTHQRIHRAYFCASCKLIEDEDATVEQMGLEPKNYEFLDKASNIWILLPFRFTIGIVTH